MIRKLFLFWLYVWILSFCTTTHGNDEPSPLLKGLWENVEKSQKSSLPQTALGDLDTFLQQATMEKNRAALVRGLALKATLEGRINDEEPEEKIHRLEDVISESEENLRPLLTVVLANWYRVYLEENRWSVSTRSRLEQSQDTDLATWDLNTFIKKIDALYGQALSNPELKQESIANYDFLLAGDVPKRYQPTLYDCVVQDALAFYQMGELGVFPDELVDEYELKVESPAFLSDEAFLSWDLPDNEKAPPILRSFAFYQDLLRFHQDDEDPSAYQDADLQRLQFAYKQIPILAKERYREALQDFVQLNSNHETSARASYWLADLLKEEGQLAEAHAMAQKAVEQYPESIGGRECYNLIQEIEAKAIHIVTERVWNGPLTTIDIHYRNVNKAYFRAVPYDWRELAESGSVELESFWTQDYQDWLHKTPAMAWSVELPTTDDFHFTKHTTLAPVGLKPGSYYIVASSDPTFGNEDSQLSYANIWVSELAMILRSRDEVKRIRPFWNLGSVPVEGFVVNAISGEPQVGANVEYWRGRGKGHEWIHTVRTDSNGFFRILINDEDGGTLLAKHHGQELASDHVYSGNDYYTKESTEVRTTLFTDRSIYRPGQTNHFKGMVYKMNGDKNHFKVLPRKRITLLFWDARYEEIAKETVETNEFGSFSGTFIAPKDTLTGKMSILNSEDTASRVYIRVEEYKRPKFKVDLQKPQESVTLGEEVVLSGVAASYADAKVSDAKVTYRVSRKAKFPAWVNRKVPSSLRGKEDITRGELKTQADGSFVIRFVDDSANDISQEYQPIFEYFIHVEVTDATGETQTSEESIRVGHSNVTATLQAEEWQTIEAPMTLQITTSSLDGNGLPAKGVVRVYRVKEPLMPKRSQVSLSDGFIIQTLLDTNKSIGKDYFMNLLSESEPAEHLSWKLGRELYTRKFTTNEKGLHEMSISLNRTGTYRFVLEMEDQNGHKVQDQITRFVLNPKDSQFPVKAPHFLVAKNDKVEPGETFEAVWGTGYISGQAFVEIYHKDRPIQSYWTDPETTQTLIEQPVTEAHRGGFTAYVTFVRENRAYTREIDVEVPWSSKQLDIQWQHFTSKLKPQQKETWTAVISGPEANEVAVEMVATLYDASLDAFSKHYWPQSLSRYFPDGSTDVSYSFQNEQKAFRYLYDSFVVDSKSTNWEYRTFIDPILLAHPLYMLEEGGLGNAYAEFTANDPFGSDSFVAYSASVDNADTAFTFASDPFGPPTSPYSFLPEQEPPAPFSESPDLSHVSTRKNLQDTAFFFPHLQTDEDGVVRLEFTMPDTVTSWNFMGFAHDKELRSGFIQATAVTSKELMVQPNPPRFLREGDQLAFPVKVSNLTDSEQNGTVELNFRNVETGENVSTLLGIESPQQPFSIPPSESKTFFWNVSIPDGIGLLTYKAVAASQRFSDGEEAYLPVLSRMLFVQESLPLNVQGKETREYQFKKLLNSEQSDTLRNESLTVQIVSNPSWYAVMALPYLMEFPHECSEQTFNRYYADALGNFIVESDPTLRSSLSQWQTNPTPLQQNQDLLSITLQETPWVHLAKDMESSRRNLARLLDSRRLQQEQSQILWKLRKLQSRNGSWPWFSGGNTDHYITLYLTAGFGRLRNLGVDTDVSLAMKSLQYLDEWMLKIYHQIQNNKDPHENHLTPDIAYYLYARSFFLKDKPLHVKEPIDYFLQQAQQYWPELNNLQSQAHLTLALKRFGKAPDTAQLIVQSIKERAIENEEMGMYWRQNPNSWSWQHAPIETHAILMEVLDEVAKDQPAVEAAKIWLLKQKQTRDWETSKATADAVYALLLRGRNLTKSGELVSITLGDTVVEPENVEAGTGVYEKRFAADEMKPEFGNISLTKTDGGTGWGSVHWQYFEDISKITPNEDNPLQLSKTLFKKVHTPKGTTLHPVDGPVSVGDELVVQLVLRSDRHLEYVHLKDYRGSGTEPMNVLSGYRHQEGLSYYESTKDTASHFYIGALPKGTYVFEYSLRPQHKGEYSTGIARIQCMYAPEFSAHSESMQLTVE